jgi:hypothetical protein
MFHCCTAPLMLLHLASMHESSPGLHRRDVEVLHVLQGRLLLCLDMLLHLQLTCLWLQVSAIAAPYVHCAALQCLEMCASFVVRGKCISMSTCVSTSVPRCNNKSKVLHCTAIDMHYQ